MVILINFADYSFKLQPQLNSKTAKEIANVDKIISYSTKDIDHLFLKRNNSIFQFNKGFGYFLWKPYFIKQTLDALHKDDILFYCDSGSYFINPITQLLEILYKTECEVISFDLTHKERKYTKRDCFIALDCDNEQYANSNQRLARD